MEVKPYQIVLNKIIEIMNKNESNSPDNSVTAEPRSTATKKNPLSISTSLEVSSDQDSTPKGLIPENEGTEESQQPNKLMMDSIKSQQMTNPNKTRTNQNETASLQELTVNLLTNSPTRSASQDSIPISNTNPLTINTTEYSVEKSDVDIIKPTYGI
ncbi:hypothetical protein MOUN0_O10264 [Monosporozyma unispora]